MNQFHSLGLPQALIQGIDRAGYQIPTPIQTQAIPSVLKGEDLIGCAQTGTGKTAAFVLPLLARLLETPSGSSPRALLITPTRELAQQVEDAIKQYGYFTPLRSVAIYGGTRMQPQIKALRRGVDIVVATPGRLLDHLNRGNLTLDAIEVLVLDEADRMLDMGFIPDIRKIVAKTPRNRQTLLFSATMPPPIHRLAKSIMRQPAKVEIGHQQKPTDTVKQQVCFIPQAYKMDLLLHVLETETTENVLIFSRTKHRANRIQRKLEQKGYKTTVLHSDRTQNQRQRALDGFKRGKFQIMVATDIAARGLDVENISHVINFDTPEQVDAYIHRIGRTGRAQTSGEAITFVANEERKFLQQIERFTGKRLYRKYPANNETSSPVETPTTKPARRRRRTTPANN